MSDQDPPQGSFFIDYPMVPSDVAVGDLLCFKGGWRRVKAVTNVHWNSTREYRVGGAIIFEDLDEYDRAEYYSFPLPRIAGPLLDALKNRDPYR